jgi:hypothetical protein
MTTSNREWLRRQVEAEDGGSVSVGGFVMAIEQLATEHATVKHLRARQAFARLVELKRRESALSLEQFADSADIDLREVVGIETDDRFTRGGSLGAGQSPPPIWTALPAAADQPA